MAKLNTTYYARSTCILPRLSGTTATVIDGPFREGTMDMRRSLFGSAIEAVIDYLS